MLALALHSLVLAPARLESARLVPTQTGVSASHERAARVAKILQRCSSRPGLRAWSHAHRKRARCPSARACGTGPGSKIAVYAQAHRVQPYGRPRPPRLIPMCGSCRCLATEACTAALRRSRISLRNLVWSDSCRSCGEHRKENERLSRDQATLLLRWLKTATIPVVKIGAILHHASILFWQGAHCSSVTSNYIYYIISTCIISYYCSFFMSHGLSFKLIVISTYIPVNP